VNARRNVPSLDGARTPVNSRSIAPCRSTSMSSMESAPTTIPATSEVTFSGAFAVPDPVRVRCSASRSCSPARPANLSTGDNPAHDTKFGSSKTAVDS